MLKGLQVLYITLASDPAGIGDWFLLQQLGEWGLFLCLPSLRLFTKESSDSGLQPEFWGSLQGWGEYLGRPGGPYPFTSHWVAWSLWNADQLMLWLIEAARQKRHPLHCLPETCLIFLGWSLLLILFIISAAFTRFCLAWGWHGGFTPQKSLAWGLQLKRR